MRLIDKYNEVQKVGGIEVPWQVMSCLGLAKHLLIVGDQISFAKDADFSTIEESRSATTWLVEQLGGKVKWDK